MRVEKKDVLNTVCVRDLRMFPTWLAHSEPHVCVEIQVEKEWAAMQPIIMRTCRRFEGSDVVSLLIGMIAESVHDRSRWIQNRLCAAGFIAKMCSRPCSAARLASNLIRWNFLRLWINIFRCATVIKGIFFI